MNEKFMSEKMFFKLIIVVNTLKKIVGTNNKSPFLLGRFCLARLQFFCDQPK